MAVAQFPLMPPRSTTLRMEHFDEFVYDGGPATLLYKYVDALCGVTGAGSLVAQLFVARAGGTGLHGIGFTDLDTVFNHINFLSRTAAESYPYSPNTDMLTSDQWDEVRVKDSWYRARIKNYFQGIQAGPTPVGMRMVCNAAVGVDCDILEVWSYADDFGLSAYPVTLGRSPVTARNEVVIRPHKDSLTPAEFRLLREMYKKMMPADAIVTINTSGIPVNAPLSVSAVAADSSYFEVQKVVTPTPILADLPAPELLAIDLDPTEQWLFKHSPELAPYAAYNISQESAYYYLVGGGARSPIDSVRYGTVGQDSTLITQPDFIAYAATSQYTDWISYQAGDSPDNYPGGKEGLTPDVAPALNPDGTPYVFPYDSQADYVFTQIPIIEALGGVADSTHYKLPIQKAAQTKQVFTADLAVAFSPPTKESTVTASWTARRDIYSSTSSDINNQTNFTRTS